jgi:hypothetical protein
MRDLYRYSGLVSLPGGPADQDGGDRLADRRVRP